jgi:hypothetical protein
MKRGRALALCAGLLVISCGDVIAPAVSPATRPKTPPDGVVVTPLVQGPDSVADMPKVPLDTTITPPPEDTVIVPRDTVIVVPPAPPEIPPRIPLREFFTAWSQGYKDSPIRTQTFSLDIRQERQFVDWYVTEKTLAFARAYPGQLYIIGDEPDQFCTTPAEYADLYHAAIVQIRAVDPTARFSPSGFAEPNSYCDYDNHSTVYAEKFYDSYVQQFKQAPPVAEWRFHDFALDVPDLESWWSRVDAMAAWSVVHGANMVLASWGFLGWPEVPQMKEAMKRLNADTRINGAVWWSLESWLDTTHPLEVNGVLTEYGKTYCGCER